MLKITVITITTTITMIINSNNINSDILFIFLITSRFNIIIIIIRSLDIIKTDPNSRITFKSYKENYNDDNKDVMIMIPEPKAT